MKRILALENGQIFRGHAFGASDDVIGEVVFNTGMTGYQEVLTDPSYYGQIVTMTYPLIGNYGINEEDSESFKIHAKAFIVREYCKVPSNFRSKEPIDEFLKKQGIPGIYDIDTRALTIMLREYGTMRGMIANEDIFDFDISKKEILSYAIKDPLKYVSSKNISTIKGKGGYDIAVLDLGMKKNIAALLAKRGHNITIYPADTKAEDILSAGHDGLMLTNGPGDPKESGYVVKTARMLIGKIPMFGICLGHQIIALALGYDTAKLKYGHRGSNHPVLDINSDRTYITSQNHGYTVIEPDCPDKGIIVTHRNLNDGTIEGLRYEDACLFTVQFHPEASPGPNDTSFLFDNFTDMIGVINAKKK